MCEKMDSSTKSKYTYSHRGDDRRVKKLSSKAMSTTELEPSPSRTAFWRSKEIRPRLLVSLFRGELRPTAWTGSPRAESDWWLCALGLV